MESEEKKIRTVAHRHGIAPRYMNIQGKWVEVPLETLRFILEAMGISWKDDHPTPPLLPPVVASKGRTLRLPFSQGKGEFSIFDERGEEIIHSSFAPPFLSLTLPPHTPWGYYTVEVYTPSSRQSILWVFSPFRNTLLPERIWGVNVALYALKTSRNQGIGDFEDLHLVSEVLQKEGGGFVGLLPLHLTAKSKDLPPSPYYPLDRLSFEPLYLPVDRISHEFSFLGIPYEESFFAEEKNTPLVDHRRVWDKKDRFLRSLFSLFSEKRNLYSERWGEFQSFLKERGPRLLQASLFQLLAEEEGFDWEKWPAQFRLRDSSALEETIRRREKEVLYYAFLQWLCERSLRDLSTRFPFLGFDLPIGSSPWGIESWIEQEKVVFSCSIGAPPDDFAPQGQNWGMPPFHPFKERESHYRHFIALLRFNLRFARFLRIDHIMGLQRLFWIPNGATPKEGTYVRNFFHELLAILTLESHRHQAVIIGEDLGTVPPSVHSAMQKSGLFSTKVLYFHPDGEHYPEKSLATPNTHDMPTLRGFLTQSDIDLREKLGIFSPEMAHFHHNAREKFIHHLLTLWQKRQWIAPHRLDDPEEFLAGVLHFLAHSPSRMVAISLDDLFLSEVQPNLPGTLWEYPNWQHRLPLEGEKLRAALRFMRSCILP